MNGHFPIGESFQFNNYRFIDVLGSELVENGTTISSKTIPASDVGHIGRAIVGGAVFGPAGAVIGALSSPRVSTSTTTATQLDLRILVNDLKSPCHSIKVVRRTTPVKHKLIEDREKADVERAYHWHSLIQVIVSRNNTGK